MELAAVLASEAAVKHRPMPKIKELQMLLDATLAAPKSIFMRCGMQCILANLPLAFQILFSLVSRNEHIALVY